MEFFPGPADRPAPEEFEQPQPVWAGSPDDILPGVTPVELLLGRSSRAAVLLSGARVYPSGIEFNVHVRVARGVDHRDLASEIFGHGPMLRRSPQAEASQLRWGLQFSDGVRVTSVDTSPWFEQPNQDHARPHAADDWTWTPSHPVLHQGGGGGGMRRYDVEYWLWPLPPPGPVLVACEWGDMGIDLTTQSIDAGPFLEAATRAQPLWS